MSPDGYDRRAPVERVVAGLTSWADKIRALDAAGYERAEIARLLGKRYQHVRNVLERGRTKMSKSDPEAAGKAGGAGVADLEVGRGGRLVLPAAFREAAGIEDGDVIEARLEGDEIRLIGRKAALRQARALVAKHVPPNVSLVEALFQERRREAAREDEGG